MLYLLLIGGIGWAAGAFAADSAADYAGSAACATCHAAIHESQSATHHSGALGKGAPEWHFGAGAQAVTYVSQVDEDHYLEHGLSFYRALQGKAPTPGHGAKGSGVKYRTFAPDAAILRCFGCHSTGRLSLGERRKVVPAETGVRCEACHGPGAAHAASPARGNIRNPGRMNGVEMNSLCGECHRMPPAKGVATNWQNAWNVRHQPVYLAESKCFASGKVTCLTCHEPHRDALVDVEAQCKGCHEAPRHPQPVREGCVGCHMPKVSPGPYLQFTNHWIGIYGKDEALRPLR